MSRLIKGYVIRRVMGVTSWVLLVCVAVAITCQLVDLYAHVNHWVVSSSAMVRLLGWKLPSLFNQLLPLVTLLGVVLAAMEFHQHGEWQLLRAYGGLEKDAGSVFSGWLLGLLVCSMLLSLVWVPAAARGEQAFWHSMLQRVSEDALPTGQWVSLGRQTGHVYVTRKSEQGTLERVWVVRTGRPEGALDVITAERVQLTPHGTGMRIRAQGVERWMGVPGRADFKQTQVARLEQAGGLATGRVKHELAARSSTWLFRHPEQQGATAWLWWRIVWPLSVWLMGWVAVRASVEAWGQGRAWPYVLVAYAVYTACLLEVRFGTQVLHWPAWVLPAYAALVALVLHGHVGWRALRFRGRS